MNDLILSGMGLVSLDNYDLSEIVFLDCSNNRLTSLPTLPQGLLYLYCGDNMLTSLPTLPIGLKVLECYHNQLVSLPMLPTSLVELNCNDNKLTSLPQLSEGLEELYCRVNNLKSLPILPISLWKLKCTNNHLLPKTNLDDIKLDEYNQMRKDLGLKTVSIVSKKELKEMREKWTIWKYRIDGEKYNQAEKEMKDIIDLTNVR